jgi:hypothetical protein
MVMRATGSGESTITSRRSGNVASQLTTVMSPTTNIMVADQNCSLLQMNARRRSAAGVVGGLEDMRIKRQRQ